MQRSNPFRSLSAVLLAALLWLTAFHVAVAQPSAAPSDQQQAEAQADEKEAGDQPAEVPAADEDAEEGGDEDDAPKHKYIRVTRDDDDQPLALETSVITFVSAGDEHKGVTIELVGAVHVGDADYYKKLNKLFEEYDVLLYELVAPEGTRIPKGGRKESGSAIGALQDGMSSLLELEHQLAKVDYTKKNFVHADMTPEEFAKSMSDRGESFLKIFMRALGQSAAQQGSGKQTISDADVFYALFAKDRSLRLKRLLAGQFEDMESSISIFEGPEGSTLITERNKKCFEVLSKELENGHKRIGVFYGAGHLADMEKRLADEFHMKRTGEKWIAAWDLKGAAKAEKEKAPEEPATPEADGEKDDRDPFDDSE